MGYFVDLVALVEDLLADPAYMGVLEFEPSISHNTAGERRYTKTVNSKFFHQVTGTPMKRAHTRMDAEGARVRRRYCVRGSNDRCASEWLPHVRPIIVWLMVSSLYL